MLSSNWTLYKRIADSGVLREGSWVEYRVRVGHRRRAKGLVFSVRYSPDERRFAQSRELAELLAQPCVNEILAMVESLHR